MWYYKTTLVILAIICITHSDAELNAQLEVLNEFLRVMLLHLGNNYGSIRKTAVSPAFDPGLNSQKSEVYAASQSFFNDYKEKKESAAEGGQSIENDRACLISRVEEARNKTIIALEECVTKNKPNLDFYDAKFRELLSTGMDYQEKIKKVNHECEVQPAASIENCVDMEILKIDTFYVNFRKEMMKFRKNFKAAVNSATIEIQSCYIDVMKKFSITLSNIELNCNKRLANNVAYHYT